MVRNIIFDFDGVILDSMSIRELGFREILSAYDAEMVEALLRYHEANGGLSRYDKIAYFYREIARESLTEKQLQGMAGAFSNIMREKLVDKRYLITQTVDFLKRHHNRYRLHIASGSDQEELRYLCTQLGIAEYFLSIYGSPEHKDALVQRILSENHYAIEETILIGDSMNDYAASHVNKIAFYGYNNKALMKVSRHYLDTYAILEKEKESKDGTGL